MKEPNELDEYLREVIKNDEKCNNCVLKHEDNICFFAHGCIKNNHSHFKLELKGENKQTDVSIDPYDMRYIRCGKGENNE